MATLKERADRGIDRAIQLLIDEGYVKGYYELTSETARAYGLPVPQTACGTKRCLVGALEAGFHPQSLITEWCDTTRRERTAKPALRRAYAAVNVAAVRHTRVGRDPNFAGFESPAEGYSEADNTRRSDVLRLLRRAKEYTGLTTPELEAEVEAARRG